jgi:hypothetical protein
MEGWGAVSKGARVSVLTAFSVCVVTNEQFDTKIIICGGSNVLHKCHACRAKECFEFVGLQAHTFFPKWVRVQMPQ